LVLVGGGTVAARLQPPSFDPLTDTVSALAAVGAADRWVMTVTFLVVAVCDVVTAVALRPARAAGRLILVAGSVAGMLVAVNPEHGGGSLSHAIWALIGFGGLAFWPAAAWRRGPVGAVGAAPGGVRLCRCGPGHPHCVVRHRGGHRRRAGWPGRAHHRRGAGTLASHGGAVLPLPVQSGHRLDGVGALTGGLSRLVP
jgi:hypothetical protein